MFTSSQLQQCMIFKCDRQVVNVSKKLCHFFANEKFADITLVSGIDQTKVRAHRNVVCAASDYLYRALEGLSGSTIELKAVDGLTLKLILNFVYSAEIEVNGDNVANVLRAADLLNLRTLTEACCNFMADNLEIENCLGVHFFAKKHNFFGLYRHTSAFLKVHFEEVLRSDEYLQLNEDKLVKFLSNEGRYLIPEEYFFNRLVDWVEYDKITRESCILNLLSLVRYQLLKPKFIFENRHLVCRRIECFNLVRSWLQWHKNGTSHIPDSSRINSKLIFSSGWFNENWKVQVYDDKLDNWSYEKFPRSPINREYCSSTAKGGKLFVVGGKTEGAVTKIVEVFNLQTQRWSDLPDMLQERWGHAVAVLNGDLYAVGGCCKGTELLSVERYSFSMEEWINVAPLLKCLKSVQVAVLNEMLYAIDSNTSAMLCYDPIANEWSHKGSRKEQTEDFGFAAVNGYLYAVGGKTSQGKSSIVEQYDPSSDSWSTVAPLSLERSRVKCAVLDNQLIVCGGYEKKGSSLIVEKYNHETNEWEHLAPLLSNPATYCDLFTSSNKS